MMLRPDQALRDRPARVAESAMQELAVQCMRVNRLPIMSEWGIPNYSMGPFNPGLMPAVTVGSISAGSTSTVGSGTVQLYYLDDNGVPTPDPDGDGNGPVGTTAVSNWWPSTIPSGAQCAVQAFSNTVWIWIWWCS
jgi:hypothetical protein